MMTQSEILKTAKSATKGIYERHAVHWHENRSRHLYEQALLDRFTESLPAKARLLDLGCGSGYPIADYFLKNGFELVGVDYAEPMIDLAKSLFPKSTSPNSTWIAADMTALPDVELFDGIYSWDGFFHLSVDEQRTLLPKLARRINPGGALLLTVGTGEGEVTGTISGETIYHASLSPAEYRDTLEELGFASVIYTAEDPECMGRSVLLASNHKSST
ncbi:MAG: class I SAM-dependent methyltransferase [Pseudomonadota bacterium]